MSALRDAEVDSNFDAFQEMLPAILGEHRGQYALLRRRQVEGYFASLREALVVGASFEDRMFSVQEVTDRAADLGLFSHAVNTRLA